MNHVGTQGMTALDFYLSLTDRVGHEECRGPLVYMRLNTVAAEKLMEASMAAEMQDEFSNTFISQMSEGWGAFGACMAHWVDLAAMTSAVGSSMERNDLKYTGDELFRSTCTIAGWDFKEVDNYLQSYGSAVEEE